MLSEAALAATRARLSRVALWLCALGCLLGVIGLVGNLLDSELLSAFIPGRSRIQLNSAIAIVLSAIAAALQQSERLRRVGRSASLALAAAILLFATLVLAEYLLDADLGVDWYFDRTQSRLRTGRPSPLTGLVLAPLSLAMLLRYVIRPGGTAARLWVCLTAVFFALVSLVGHAFGAGALYRLENSQVIGVALPTAIALSAIGVATLLGLPSTGSLRLLTAPGPGGLLVRRLGLTAVLMGPALGALLLILLRAIGLVDLPLILALGNVLVVFLALSLLVATALPLERTYQEVKARGVQFRELIEQAPEGIFIADLSGRYTEVNAAGCRLLGLARAEILGKTILDFIPQDDVERLWQSQAAMLQGAVHTAQWKLRHRDGTYVPVEVTAKVLPDGRWQGFVHDIRERLELERKLRESRDFLQEVLESSTEYGIIAEDLQGRVVLWNAGARRSYGYERDEICGEPSDVLVAEAERSTWQRLHARGVEQGSSEGMVVARRKGGETFAANVVCTRRLGPDDQATGMLIVSRDLTVEQRYLAEQEFLARVGVELASCLEYNETLTRVIKLVTSFLGDLATIDVVKDGRVQRAQALHRKPEERTMAQAVVEVGAARAQGHPLWTVLETKQPLLLAHITDEDRRRYATSPEHARVLDTVRATSGMLLPLIARGQLLAVLSIAACNGSRTYGPADLRLAVELARRAALALDNTQLFQQSRLQGAMTTNLAEGAVLVRAQDATIVYANPRLEAMFGYASGELLGKGVDVLNAHPQTASQTAEQIVEQLNRTGAWHGKIQNVRKDGSEFWSAASVSTFEHEEYGKVWIAVHSDITERKLLQEKNALALRDKEVLLKEIHHRVKNNLQVISSLFSLQRERTQNAELRGLLDESRTRVESIALVHEQLYRSAELAAIDFNEYLRSLVAAIRSTYGATDVQLEVSARDVVLDVEEAVPCALLVCELVSNSLKHAFVAGSPGRIWVRAERDDEGQCILEVEDDGRGISAEFDWTKARSLGLRLVQSLTRQLRGSIELNRANGTRFTVKFALRGSRPLAAATSAATLAAVQVH